MPFNKASYLSDILQPAVDWWSEMYPRDLPEGYVVDLREEFEKDRRASQQAMAYLLERAAQPIFQGARAGANEFRRQLEFLGDQGFSGVGGSAVMSLPEFARGAWEGLIGTGDYVPADDLTSGLYQFAGGGEYGSALEDALSGYIDMFANVADITPGLGGVAGVARRKFPMRKGYDRKRGIGDRSKSVHYARTGRTATGEPMPQGTIDTSKADEFMDELEHAENLRKYIDDDPDWVPNVLELGVQPPNIRRNAPIEAEHLRRRGSALLEDYATDNMEEILSTIQSLGRRVGAVPVEQLGILDTAPASQLFRKGRAGEIQQRIERERALGRPLGKHFRSPAGVDSRELSAKLGQLHSNESLLESLRRERDRIQVMQLDPERAMDEKAFSRRANEIKRRIDTIDRSVKKQRKELNNMLPGYDWRYQLATEGARSLGKPARSALRYAGRQRPIPKPAAQRGPDKFAGRRASEAPEPGLLSRANTKFEQKTGIPIPVAIALAGIPTAAIPMAAFWAEKLPDILDAPLLPELPNSPYGGRGNLPVGGPKPGILEAFGELIFG